MIRLIPSDVAFEMVLKNQNGTDTLCYVNVTLHDGLNLKFYV